MTQEVLNALTPGTRETREADKVNLAGGQREGGLGHCHDSDVGHCLAMTGETGETEAARSAETEGLSSRTSPQAGVAIRPPETGEERIATPVTRSLVRNDRETKETGEERIATASVRTGFAMTGEAEETGGTGETARSAETEGLSSRTSPQAGAAIRPPETGEERIATASVRTGFAMTGEAQASAPGGPGPDSAFLREHFARLSADCAALARELPDFDPAAALRDPAFLRLTAPGLGVEARSAWLALHPETLQRRAAEALGRAIASGAARPREGGRGGALPETDYRSLPRAEQQRLKQRIYDAAALGEKIYP